MKKKSQLREWIESFIIAAALVVFLRTFFFQLYKIPTESMVPTLMKGDKIFVSKLTYGPKIPFTRLRIRGFRRPQRGDVIVFVPPVESGDRNKPYVKRVIAVGGERVSIKDGNIYINGRLCTDPKIATFFYYNFGEYGREGLEVEVQKGKYYVLGDNSFTSKDSRYWGFVDEIDIIGRVVFIWFPPKRIGIVE